MLFKKTLNLLYISPPKNLIGNKGGTIHMGRCFPFVTEERQKDAWI